MGCKRTEQVEVVTLIEPDYDAYRPTIPENVRSYADWFKAAFGWNPFGTVECMECKTPIHPMQVYRCYDCRAPMHRECCMRHGGESAEYIFARRE